MNQSEKRVRLIRSLLDENPRYRNAAIPPAESDQRDLLRGLMNIRPAAPVSEEFARVQDEYLREETAAKGIVSLNDLTEAAPGLYLWQGDITRLAVDAIVNAANSGMTGCYRPCHNCIDNAMLMQVTQMFYAEMTNF